MTFKFWSPSVPDLEHEDVTFDWNDVQLFLLVARAGSFRHASNKSNKSVNALRRRIAHLEHRFCCRLFARNIRGVQLTDSGQQLFQLGLSMQEAAYRVSSAFRLIDQDRPSRVTVGAEEGLGVYWLLPKLAAFHKANPKLRVDLTCFNHELQSDGLTTDIVIDSRPPKKNDLITVRLGYVHEQLFASRRMIAECDDLKGARLIERDSTTRPDPQYRDLLRSFADLTARAKTSTLCAQHQAIRCGSGFGMLPTYLSIFDEELVAVQDDIHCRADIYLCYRPDLAEHREVRTVIDWLKSVFNPRTHPWFGDTFVPSHQLAQKKGAPSA